MMRFRTTAALTAILFAPALSAQLTNDQVPFQRTIPVRDSIRTELADARMRLGFLRVQPTLALRDLGYERTSDVDTAEFRSTVTAGARVIAPFGSKTFFRGAALPQYTWYEKSKSRRVLGGVYSGELLGLFNHMSVQAGVEATKTVSAVSSEIERAFASERRRLFARGEIDLGSRMALFATGDSQKVTLDPGEEQPTLRNLDRDETAVQGGLRFKATPNVSITTALEKTSADFTQGVARNNQTQAAILGVHLDRDRTYANITAAARSGESRAGSQDFRDFSTVTGSYFVERKLVAPITVNVYGRRTLSYALFVSNPYYFQTRNGVSMTLGIGHRIALRGSAELGSDAYPTAVPNAGALMKRTDDVQNYGAGLAIRLYRNLHFTAVASRTAYDSNFPTFNRSVFRLNTAISVSGEFFQ
jgi:hypothetical protein